MPNSQDSRRTRPVRVLLADDHELYAETLELLLALDDRIEVVGRAGSGAQAIALAVGLRPDVVLMDVHMPCVDGIRATRTVKALLPGSASSCSRPPLRWRTWSAPVTQARRAT